MDRRTFISAGLATAAGTAERVDDWQGIGHVVAVGDVHGDRDALVAVLQMAGLIDAERNWIGRNAHLVQIGDIPARGPQTRAAFDFLMQLEPKAAAAGGKVHALIGNHDAGVIYGDLRGTLSAEYGEFAQPDSAEKLERAWAEEVTAMRREGRLSSDASERSRAKAAWLESHPPGFVEHRAAFGPSGHYGSWIRSNNAVIRINDTLFIHGGISPKYVGWSRRALNTAIHKELADPSRLLPGTTTDVQGPLWFRGLGEGETGPLEKHVEAVLRSYGVKRVVVGHCVTRTAILPRFGGRVVNIDLGLSRFYCRPPACLVLQASSLHVLHRGKKIQLPDTKTPGLMGYLQSVESADEQPSPVTKLIRESKPDK